MALAANNSFNNISKTLIAVTLPQLKVVMLQCCHCTVTPVEMFTLFCICYYKRTCHCLTPFSSLDLVFILLIDRASNNHLQAQMFPDTTKEAEAAWSYMCCCHYPVWQP